jgi:hypothetical protein
VEDCRRCGELSHGDRDVTHRVALNRRLRELREYLAAFAVFLLQLLSTEQEENEVQRRILDGSLVEERPRNLSDLLPNI